jgi:Na+/H+ antiporter NhaD/arsenite permease-like protein
MFMTLPGFIILIVLGFLGLWIFVELASLPGKKATERDHPRAEAINILGWLGLLFGGVGWMVALVWAHAPPLALPAAAETNAPAPTGVPDAPIEEPT